MLKVRGYTELQIVDIVRQMLEGLSVMHKQGICHRNVKPESLNVMAVNPDSG